MQFLDLHGQELDTCQLHKSPTKAPPTTTTSSSSPCLSFPGCIYPPTPGIETLINLPKKRMHLPTHFLSTSKNLLFLLPKPQQIIPLLNHATTMSISLSSHAFAGNPIRSRTPKPTSQFSPNPALESLKSRILNGVPGNSLTQFASPDFKVLPFRKGRPLATSGEDEAAGPRWRLRWMGLDECVRFLGELSDDRFVYLGWKDKDSDYGVVYWAIDVSEGNEGIGNVKEEGWCFVELRTLMVATDWDDQSAMGELAIAGHVSVRVQVNGLILGKKV